jgi:hypothetical protein
MLQDVDVQFTKDAPLDMFSPIIAKTPSPAKGKSKSAAFKSKALIAHNEFRALFDLLLSTTHILNGLCRTSSSCLRCAKDPVQLSDRPRKTRLRVAAVFR